MIINEKELWEYLKNADKPIVLYGMGNGADKIIAVLKEKGIDFKGVFSSAGFKKDKYFHGFKVSSFEELKKEFGDMIVLLCFGSDRPEVIENVKRIAKTTEIYAPEVPVIGGGLFDKEYFNKNQKRFQMIYDRLADDLSKKTFQNTINYKLSGKVDYLFDCETTIDEPYESFMKLSGSESFLDLGAYNGDTVKDFISRVNTYNNIIAVEPDVKTFKKLILNTEDIKNIECRNICISDFCGKGFFGMRGGRNSSAQNGINEAEFTTVDCILSGGMASFIKMDIEGEELKAISGALETIKTHKPKMLVSCYHRTEDLITLPEAVFNIRDDYKLYMRHFSSLPAWDTNYYFI